MSFTPTIPTGGLAGWRFLERTAESQRAAFNKGAVREREIAYFKEKIGAVETAEALVKDRRLLTVALGAFGLDGEIDKKFLVRKVLESDTLDPKSMANRLSDPAYRKIAAAFGFGGVLGPQTGKDGFADKIVALYKERKFEKAVGEVDESMRFAMNFRREIGEIAKGSSDSAGWYGILGSKPLREVVQTALGLPDAFAQVDIDRQQSMIRERMQRAFGDDSMAFFTDTKNVEKVITRYLGRAQLEGAAAGAATSPALQLLQGAASGSAGLFNLLASRV